MCCVVHMGRAWNGMEILVSNMEDARIDCNGRF